MGNSGRLGVVAGIAGGCMMAMGAVLPWQRFVFPAGPVPGCFGCGAGPFVIAGSKIANGEVALLAGVLTVLACLLMTAFPTARKWLAMTLAAGVVLGAGAVGGWWLKQMPGAVIKVGIIEACGVMLGLAAVPLCLPGTIRQRGSVLAATALLCVAGVVLARPESSGQVIVF